MGGASGCAVGDLVRGGVMAVEVCVQWGYSCDWCGDVRWSGIISDELPEGGSFRRDLESDALGSLVVHDEWHVRRGPSGSVDEVLCSSCASDLRAEEASGVAS